MKPDRQLANSQFPWAVYLPVLLIIGWWIYDLHFQWQSLREYNFGWMMVMLTAYLV